MNSISLITLYLKLKEDLGEDDNLVVKVVVNIGGIGNFIGENFLKNTVIEL